MLRHRRSEARESSRAWRPANFPAPSSFTGCTVRCREDVPRHIYGLFQALGIQYRWVLTLGTLGRELVKAHDLAIIGDDAKEESWMAVYEHERDLLEDTVYRRLVSLWSEFSDAYAVFDQHGPAQLLCAQQVWEALLTAFPLKHKRMQTVLPVRSDASWPRMATPRTLLTPTSAKSAISAELLNQLNSVESSGCQTLDFSSCSNLPTSTCSIVLATRSLPVHIRPHCFPTMS